jgi:hypothetical protein
MFLHGNAEACVQQSKWVPSARPAQGRPTTKVQSDGGVGEAQRTPARIARLAMTCWQFGGMAPDNRLSATWLQRPTNAALKA